MTNWSPRDYLAFERERSRPAADLLAAVPLAAPGRIVDLGCGPGNSTALLRTRYPDAAISGLDNSAAMLEAARARLPDVAFSEGDIADFVPDAGTDLLFANAALHWLPDHLAVMARLLEALPCGGVLAVQMPDNTAEPSHRAMVESAAAGPWAERLAEAARDPLPSVGTYYDRLRPLAARLDIWRTTYHHPLAGIDAVVDWVSGTGLLPFLGALEAEEKPAFLADYRARLAGAYRKRIDGSVLLAYPRLFVIAERSAAE